MSGQGKGNRQASSPTGPAVSAPARAPGQSTASSPGATSQSQEVLTAPAVSQTSSKTKVKTPGVV